MADDRSIFQIITEGGQAALAQFSAFAKGAQASLSQLAASAKPTEAAFKGISEASDNLKTRMTDMSGALGSLGTVFAAMGPAGLAAGAALGGVALAASKGMQVYSEYERVQLRINNALERTGHISGQTAGSIEGLAQSISANTNASTQSVREAADQLLIFQGVTGQTFERALRLSADLAESWQMDMGEAAQNLGELLTDPIGAMEELGSRGVFFDEGLRKNIESMQKAGDTARLYETLLNKVSEHLQGQGSAAAQGYAGSLNNLNDEVFEVLKRIGELANGTGVLGQAMSIASGAVKGFRETVLGTGDPVDELTRKINELNKQRESLAKPTNEIAVAGVGALETQVGPIVSNPGKMVKDTIGVLGELANKILDVGKAYFKTDEERKRATESAIKLFDNNIAKLEQEKAAILDNRRILQAVSENTATTNRLREKEAKEEAERREQEAKDAEAAQRDVQSKAEAAAREAKSKREARAREEQAERERIAELTVNRYREAEERKTKIAEEEEQNRIQKGLESINQRRQAEEKLAREIEQKQANIARTTIERYRNAEQKKDAEAEDKEQQRIQKGMDDIRARVAAEESRVKKEEELIQHRQDAMRNAADNITQILERVVEDDWIGAINGFFNFAGEGLQDLGAQFQKLGELSGNLGQQQMGAVMGTIGTSIQAAGAGVGMGQAMSGLTNKMGMGSTTGGAVSGAVGGAVAGTMIFPGIGTAVGAIIGGVLGGIMGTSKEPATFASGIRTTREAPARGESADAVSRRTPFGVVSLPAEGARGIAGFRDLETIAKLDRSIAQFLTEQQKARVSGALAGTTTGEIKGDEFGAAAGDAFAQRMDIILKAAVGGAEGQRVSQRFQEINPRGSPEERAQILGEILEINMVLENALNPKNLTEFESAAENVKKQFAELRPMALDYGFSLERVNAAEAAAMGQLRKVVDTDIDKALTSLSDPFKATMDQLAEEGQLRLRNVRAVGGDVKDAIKLNTMLVENARRERREQMTDFGLDIKSQILSVTDKQAAAELDLVRQRDQMLRQARELGASDGQVKEIFRLFGIQLSDLRRQAASETRFANLSNQAAFMSIANPRQGERLNLDLSQQQRRQEAREAGQNMVILERLFQAERIQLARRFAEEDREVRQQQIAEARQQAQARQQALAQERAARQAQAQARQEALAQERAAIIELRQQRAEEFRELRRRQGEMKTQLRSQTLEITSPLQAAFFNLRMEQQALLKQVKELGMGHAALAAAQRLVNLQTNALRAQQNAQRAGFNADIQQQILQIQDPIKAELFALHRSYQEKLKQAREFGVSSANIDKLYLLEREQILQRSVDTNRQQITDFITELTARPGSSPLAPQTVLANAEEEFTGTLGGSDAGKFVDAARAYKDSAQAVFGSGPEFFAVFDKILAEARRFGLSTAELGATAGDRAEQQQRQVQQRQAEESKQHATRMESLMLEQLGLMRQFVQWYQTINQTSRQGSANIVQAIARGQVGSLAGKRAA
jgi:Prophage tail length tape measure protein